MQKRTFADALRFIFSPVDNPFFAVMWRQQRRNMGQFFLHLGMILGFVWLAFTAVGLLMERFNFSFQTRAIALYEITAWAHFFAVGIYGVTAYRRYQQFWRRDTLPQLLLTGVPPILIALAIPVYPLFIQAYIALLCLPFYAAAKNLSGIPWSTVLLDASIIALLASLPGSTGMSLWWLLFQLSIWTAPFPYSFTVWSQLPLLLTLPVRFFAWSVPTWLLVVVGILLLSVISFTSWAWFLEPRFYPSQVRVLWWAHRAWLLATVFVCGLMWAYWFPSDFAAKVAFSLVLIRLLFSVEFLSLASTRSDEAPRTPTRWADAEVLVANGLMLSVCGLVGWAEGLAISKIAPVLAIGGLLGILHYMAHSLSANWWRKVMVAQRMPLTWWLAFSVWLIAPLVLLIPPISPLASFHGWLLPLTLMPTSLQQQISTSWFHEISTSWFHGIRISLPHWSLMAIVQIAWAGLLWTLERMSKLPQVQPEEKRREWLTANHPLWGWLARLEEQLCERFANPLVTLQLRQQSRDKVLHATMTIGVIANLSVLSIWLLSRIFPQQDFVAFTEGLLIRLPSLAGLAGAFSALVVNTSHEQKSALWLLGRKRVVESFVLAPFTADQWKFGWWFPRFWLCLKATMPYALCAWLGIALRPSLGFALVAILVTASLPVTALAWALAGLSVSMMRQWETILAFSVWKTCFLATLISKGWHLHALVWLLWFVFSTILAVSCRVIVSKRIGLLRTPSGYEQWLKLTEEKFRRARS